MMGIWKKKSQGKKPRNNILGKSEKNPVIGKKSVKNNEISTIYVLLVVSRHCIRKQCYELHFTYTRFINKLFL